MSQFSNPKKVMIPCRFSFLHCWEPDSVNGSEPKYSVSAIIPKSDTKTVSAIKAAIYPADTDYYFFALGTDKKSHFFTDYNEHLRFVNSAEYQPIYS